MCKYRVMVIDDEEDWLFLLSHTLQRESCFQVATVSSSTEALERIQTERPDAILLDLIMPHMDGVDTVRMIKNIDPTYQPIIYVISGLTSSAAIYQLNQCGIDYYTAKPVSSENVLRILKQLISYKSKQPMFSICKARTAREVLCSLLEQLGISAHTNYAEYTIAAILRCMGDESYLQLLTKRLYPEIAKEYGLLDNAIEHGIRYCFQQIRKHNTSLAQHLFPDLDQKKYSNSAVLHILTDYGKEEMEREAERYAN